MPIPQITQQPKRQRPIPVVPTRTTTPTNPNHNRDLYYTSTTNGFYARPVGQLGTCGWHPIPWQCGFGATPELAFLNFYDNNPCW